MRFSEHPRSLEDFIAGRLDVAEDIAVITHLAECDVCLTEADRLWAKFLLEELTAIPLLSSEQIQRMKQQLLHRIQRANLGGQAVHLGTDGFLRVSLALVLPLFGSSKA